jgi:hypothetical protein
MGSSNKRKQQQLTGSSSAPSIGATTITPLEVASPSTAHVQKKRKVVAAGQSAPMVVSTLEEKEEASPISNGNVGGLFGLGNTLPHSAALDGSEEAQDEGFEKIMTKDEKRKEKKRKREEKLALVCPLAMPDQNVTNHNGALLETDQRSKVHVRSPRIQKP